MIQNKRKNKETFNDGILNVLKANKRTIESVVMSNVHFGNKTVGVSRFYNAATVGSVIDKLISVPFGVPINRLYLIEIEDEIFSIKQIQEKYDTLPPTLLLSLEKDSLKYVDGRKD